MQFRAKTGHHIRGFSTTQVSQDRWDMNVNCKVWWRLERSMAWDVRMPTSAHVTMRRQDRQDEKFSKNFSSRVHTKKTDSIAVTNQPESWKAREIVGIHEIWSLYAQSIHDVPQISEHCSPTTCARGSCRPHIDVVMSLFTPRTVRTFPSSLDFDVLSARRRVVVMTNFMRMLSENVIVILFKSDAVIGWAAIFHLSGRHPSAPTFSGFGPRPFGPTLRATTLHVFWVWAPPLWVPPFGPPPFGPPSPGPWTPPLPSSPQDPSPSPFSLGPLLPFTTFTSAPGQDLGPLGFPRGQKKAYARPPGLIFWAPWLDRFLRHRSS